MPSAADSLVQVNGVMSLSQSSSVDFSNSRRCFSSSLLSRIQGLDPELAHLQEVGGLGFLCDLPLVSLLEQDAEPSV